MSISAKRRKAYQERDKIDNALMHQEAVEKGLCGHKREDRIRKPPLGYTQLMTVRGNQEIPLLTRLL
jgi:hypothetical protein